MTTVFCECLDTDTDDLEPLEKRLVMSLHTSGSDPIQLIFDNDPTIAINLANFVAATEIKLTDTFDPSGIV